jgi:hypothetical protein
MLLPATNLYGLPRQPWLYQQFSMPNWVVTPTVNGGTSLNLKLHVAVNPEGTAEPDPLYVTLRDTSDSPLGDFNPITLATGAQTPAINPSNPDPNNREWILKSFNLADGFTSPGNLLDYKDEDLQLYFYSDNPSGTYSTRFYLDNVELELCTQEPKPTQYNTLVAGEALVWINGVPTEKPGVYIWIYAIDGSMEKTYTIHDSTFSFYDLPASQDGTQYILYAEYWEGSTFYSASTIIVLKPGQTIDSISLLLF